jgi:hypothetical protein
VWVERSEHLLAEPARFAMEKQKCPLADGH